MARRRKGRPINGVILLDKPTGISSNDALQKVKRIYFAEKAGHTGALDPLATGMLPICLGEATKFSQFLLDSDKRYVVIAKLGERTNTSDSDGEVVETREINVTQEQLERCIASFKGETDQIPSMFSALNPKCTFGLRRSKSITIVFLPLAAINPAKFRITNVFPSPDMEDDTAITRASLFIKLMFDRILLIASAIRDFEDSVTTT